MYSERNGVVAFFLYVSVFIGLSETDEIRVFSARAMSEKLYEPVLLPDSFGRKTRRSPFSEVLLYAVWATFRAP